MELNFTLEQIESAANELLDVFEHRKVFAFHGHMGAGKTTFITVLCRLKGVTGTVSSPTFSIINQYDASGKTVYHMDLYRLKDNEEAIQAGVEDVLYSGETCFVEWPERAPEIFPDGTVHVFIEALDETVRKLTVTS